MALRATQPFSPPPSVCVTLYRMRRRRSSVFSTKEEPNHENHPHPARRGSRARASHERRGGRGPGPCRGDLPADGAGRSARQGRAGRGQSGPGHRQQQARPRSAARGYRGASQSGRGEDRAGGRRSPGQARDRARRNGAPDHERERRGDLRGLSQQRERGGQQCHRAHADPLPHRGILVAEASHPRLRVVLPHRPARRPLHPHDVRLHPRLPEDEGREALDRGDHPRGHPVRRGQRAGAGGVCEGGWNRGGGEYRLSRQGDLAHFRGSATQGG